MIVREIRPNEQQMQLLLASHKTQARQVVVPTDTTPRITPLSMEPCMHEGEQVTDDDGLQCWLGHHPDYPTGTKWFSSPFGKRGDALYVYGTDIVLEILDVRVERLHDISEISAQCEGWDMSNLDPFHAYDPVSMSKAREWFQKLWDSINGEQYPWHSNPYVWVIEFQRENNR